MKHTHMALPWFFNPVTTDAEDREFGTIQSGSMSFRDMVVDSVYTEDAAFIVRACNSRAELVAALEAAVYFLEENKGRIGYASGSPMHKKIKEMSAAIAKAKGEA